MNTYEALVEHNDAIAWLQKEIKLLQPIVDAIDNKNWKLYGFIMPNIQERLRKELRIKKHLLSIC